MSSDITLIVNGESYPLSVDAHDSLLHTVRGQVGLTGSKEGCDDSECGACMMLIDGRTAYACTERLKEGVTKLAPLPKKKLLRDLVTEIAPPDERLDYRSGSA